jgi:membrane dipeptidase
MAAMTRRRALALGGGALAAAAAGGYLALRPRPAPIGFAVSDSELAWAREFLAEHMAIDAHAHPGRTFVRGAQHLSGKVYLAKLLGTFEATTVAQMREGGLTAAAFAAVSDFQALGFKGEGLEAVRSFGPGEAWESYRRQIANLKQLSASGLVYPVLSAEDFAAAHRSGKPGAFLTVEGGDFLEGKAERVAQAHADGVRSITLMHYRTNELGDIITGKPVHGGLTPAGEDVVRAMNQAGLLIDVAHASEATAFAAVAASARPVMASHVHIHGGAADHPRFISRDLAQAVAQRGGGVLGAWPAGIGITDLAGFVRRTLELIDTVGIDHVCLGTDMDANYRPVFDNYAHLPQFLVGLRQKGLADDGLAKLIGGNFLRLFGEACTPA